MKKTLLVIFSLCYALLFGEIFLRIMDPVPLMPRYVAAAPYGVRMNMPNADYWQTTPETQVNIRINNQGIRSDREYTLDKPEGTCRILILGDSFFAGYEVELEESFAYLLEKGLQNDGYTCEVINLAVSGFGTAEMLATTEAYGLQFQPDIIVFQWHTTDLADNIRTTHLYEIDDQGHFTRSNAEFLPGVSIRTWLTQFALYRFLIENSQFYSAIREAAGVQLKGILASLNKNDAEEVHRHLTDKNKRVPFELSLALLKHGAKIANDNHAHFVVLEIPDVVTRTSFQSSIKKFSESDRSYLNFLSPINTFHQHADPNRKIFYEKGHFHLSPWGNQLLTDYFIQKLEATEWLSPYKK